MAKIKKLILAGLIGSAVSAYAGESLFSRAYTVETVPQGHYELEQTFRLRSERAFGEYQALDLKSEFEYGIRDNFQVAFYVNSGYLHAKNAPDDNDPQGDQAPLANGQQVGFSRDSFHLQSLSTEFIYRAMSPVTDPIGLAFYYEPEWDFYDIHNGAKEYGSFENEFRVLLQKNFLNDQLILVYNFVIELEYYSYNNKAADTPYFGELDWNNEIGLSYRFASNWYGGVEVRNHNELGNFWSHDHSVYWAGPVVHYASGKFWATLGFLRQVYGVPSGPDSVGSNQGPSGYFLHSHEMMESTLKIGFPF